jgi:hypothetical protein
LGRLIAGVHHPNRPMLLPVGADLGPRRARWPATKASTKVEPYKNTKEIGRLVLGTGGGRFCSPIPVRKHKKTALGRGAGRRESGQRQVTSYFTAIFEAVMTGLPFTIATVPVTLTPSSVAWQTWPWKSLLTLLSARV